MSFVICNIVKANVCGTSSLTIMYVEHQVSQFNLISRTMNQVMESSTLKIYSFISHEMILSYT